jgi:hypothetical protein
MKTAVEFLASVLSQTGPITEDDFNSLVEQAKEIEEEQLYNFIDFINERHFNSFRISKDEVEQYYNETFKQ